MRVLALVIHMLKQLNPAGLCRKPLFFCFCFFLLWFLRDHFQLQTICAGNRPSYKVYTLSAHEHFSGYLESDFSSVPLGLCFFFLPKIWYIIRPMWSGRPEVAQEHAFRVQQKSSANSHLTHTQTAFYQGEYAANSLIYILLPCTNLRYGWHRWVTHQFGNVSKPRRKSYVDIQDGGRHKVINVSV